MKEDELRTDVLMPMFAAMGFQDVYHNHGVGEKGKDIVMWWPTPLGDRENYAVIVKATPITGKAGTREGNAGEVFMQINQALGSAFTDQTTLQSRRVTKCFVVTPHAIRPEAVEALKAALGGRADDGTVTLMAGDKLWETLERYSPDRTLARRLQFASQVLDQLSPDHRVTARLAGGHIQLGLEPKHPNAPPATFSAQFEFPATPTGDAVRLALDAHVRRGTPVIIPPEFVRELEMPAAIQSFFDSVPEIRLEAAPSDWLLHASIVARGSGEEARLAVRFRRIRGGTEEVEIETVDQALPWMFHFTLNRVNHQAFVRFSFPGWGAKAKPDLEAARFANVLSKGADLVVIDENTGLQLLSMPVSPGIAPAPDRFWIQFLDSLVFIQQRCNVEVPIPSDVPIEDVRAVIDLARTLRAGVWEGPVESVKLELKPGPVPEPLVDLAPEGTRVVVVRDEWFEVFGVRVPLGIVMRAATHMRLTEESRGAVASHRDDAPLSVVLEATPVSSGTIAFTKWLEESALEALKARWPGVSFSLPEPEEGV